MLDASEDFKREQRIIRSGKVTAKKFRYTYGEFIRVMAKLVEQYNATPQNGLLHGLSPNEAFEILADNNDPPIQFNNELHWMLAKPSAANANGPLAKLKEVWRRLPESNRDYWRGLLSSPQWSQSQIRAEIFEKFKIKLSQNGKISLFRMWILDQDKLDQEAERQQDEERKIVSEHPDWTLDRVREEVLRRSYFRSLASGDFKFGLKVLSADTQGRFKGREVSLAEN